MTNAKQVYEWVKTGHWNRRQFLEWAQPKQALCDLAEDGVCETLDCPNHPIEQGETHDTTTN